MIQDAVELIKRKKKPMIICGGGVRYSEAADALKTFAETFNIPFAETQLVRALLFGITISIWVASVPLEI